MSPAIVIRFGITLLNAKKAEPSEFHCQIVKYMVKVQSDRMVRRWARMFNEGRGNVHDEVQSGQLSVINDGSECTPNKNVCADRGFTFPEIPRTVQHEIVTDNFFRKLCSPWVTKTFCLAPTVEHKTDEFRGLLHFYMLLGKRR